MNKKVSKQIIAGILFLVLGFISFLNGIFEPSERSALSGIALIIAGAYLIYTEDNNHRELMPVKVRARN